jgi:hypothetical protein
MKDTIIVKDVDTMLSSWKDDPHEKLADTPE